MAMILIDLNKKRAELIRQSLARTPMGLNIESFQKPTDAVSWVEQNKCNLFVVDQKILEDTVHLKTLKSLPRDVPILVLQNDDKEVPLDLDNFVHEVIGPVIERATLLQRIENLLGLQQSKEKLRNIQESISERGLERFELAVSASNDGVWDWDLARDLVFYSPRWCEIIGFQIDEVEPNATSWFARVHPDDAPLLETAIQTHLEGSAERIAIEYRIRHKNGYYRWVLTRGQVLQDVAGQPRRLVGSQTDITDRKSEEQEMSYNALHDPLTGTANRALLMERLQQIIVHQRRDPTQLYSVMFLDLDEFKDVNDNLGHEAGDQILKTVTQRMTACVREQDTVARLGGDEFVILVAGTSDQNEVEGLATRILSEIEKPIKLHDMSVRVSVSIGIVTDTSEYKDAEMSVRDADLALYHAKSKGRNRYEIFNHTMEMSSSKHFTLQHTLLGAKDRQELLLHYQPVVSLETGEVAGFEALMRWQHPENGIIYPLDFIPLAEEIGLIKEMGSWGLQKACEQLREWQQTMPGSKDWFMCVNVSGRQLDGDGLADVIHEVLSETGIAGNNLIVEITENILMHDIYQVLPRLHQLKELGIQLAIDDFGTGYSSLAVLNDFPFNILKVAREFVTGIDGRQKSARTVKLIHMLAKEMKMLSIVEGIETVSEYEVVKRIGCELAQGFYFSRPKDAQTITAFLEADPKGAFVGSHKSKKVTA